MMLETARMEDLEAICALYESTCAQMQAAGLNQWSWGEYPSRDIVREDLEAGRLYVARQASAPICAVAIDQEQEEQYARVDWLFGTRPGSFHRFAVAGELRGQGLGRKVLGEIIQILQGMGCDSLRCDTSAENAAALHLYESQGMRRAGTVHYPPNLSQDYPCLEMPLTADCPLLPIPMTPAFRGGSLTPWGGKKLREVYGKKIPNDTTGESLEVSCIPGLESADPMGVKLPELIARYGEKLVGAYAGETFPLLLKLLDARESLSVQVHPNDAYAHEHEHGKLGKTEAWLILRAEPGSELVYGIVPGTELEQLRSACLAGAAVFLAVGGPLMGLFTRDAALIAQGRQMLRCLCVGLPVAALQMSALSYLSATGKAVSALIVSLCRQVVIFLPMVGVLNHFFGFVGLALAYPVTDVLSTVPALILCARDRKLYARKAAQA